MDITIPKAAELLLEQDQILILSHRAPDGDTLGSAAALGTALVRRGKQVRFLCSDEPDKKFLDLFAEVPFFSPEEAFQPGYLVSVDIASTNLFGDALAPYLDRVDLCIDHHVSNGDYAKLRCLDPHAAATGELIYDLLGEMGTPIDAQIADCLYMALSTDTGCFKYPNTTSRTLRIAAALIDCGAHSADINRRMFDTLSHARVALERLALERLQFHYNGLCAVMYLPRSILEQTGAKGTDLDGIIALPRQLEGVLVGMTVRERKDGGFKFSLRGEPPVNCSEICEQFGGGGHQAAAGCVLDVPTFEEAQAQILPAVQCHLAALGLLTDAPAGKE